MNQQVEILIAVLILLIFFPPWLNLAFRMVAYSVAVKKAGLREVLRTAKLKDAWRTEHPLLLNYPKISKKRYQVIKAFILTGVIWNCGFFILFIGVIIAMILGY